MDYSSDEVEVCAGLLGMTGDSAADHYGRRACDIQHAPRRRAPGRIRFLPDGFPILSMAMAHAGARLSEVAVSRLCVAAPSGPAVSLHAPHAREGAAGVPASHNAHHDKQLVQQPAAVRPSQRRGRQSGPLRDRAARPRAVAPPRRRNGLSLGESGHEDAGDVSDHDVRSALVGRIERRRRGGARSPRGVLGRILPTPPNVMAVRRPVSAIAKARFVDQRSHRSTSGEHTGFWLHPMRGHGLQPILVDKARNAHHRVPVHASSSPRQDKPTARDFTPTRRPPRSHPIQVQGQRRLLRQLC